MPTYPVTDLVVVLPGIMGSVLAKDGYEVWNHTLAVAGRHALGRLNEVRALALPRDIGDADPGDGVEAVGLIKGLHVLPGVSAIDGYGTLLTFLERRLGVSERNGNLLSFPYDWRLSVRRNAHRLAARVEPALAAWRARTGDPMVRTVFVAHSLGGLVARYYLDVLGGSRHARSLVTIGTPYRGSVYALTSLHGGLAPRLGRLSDPFTRLARSMPSLHQLLPTWRCLVGADGCVPPWAGPVSPAWTRTWPPTRFGCTRSWTGLTATVMPCTSSAVTASPRASRRGSPRTTSTACGIWTAPTTSATAQSLGSPASRLN
ncbi:lipase family alpha/beta hydrolase [Streptomyces sp. NPDC088350]|uniref:lipase family alpha/beta hydrolase n=1 Tax=Streptomyces sp. NPDC088350 TaxID=3365854 RepID=UPI003803CA95